MPLIDRLGGDLPRGPVTVDLDEIQATVLRYRPEPYYGTHVMLHVDDAQAGREFLRRLAPHVDSAAEWWHAHHPAVGLWTSGTAGRPLALSQSARGNHPPQGLADLDSRADLLGPRWNWRRPR